MIELEQVEKTLSSRPSHSAFLPSAMGLRPHITEVYKAVAPMLGSLNAKSVSAIIKFYSMVGLHEGLGRNYQHNLDRHFQPGPPRQVLDAFAKSAKEDLETIRVLIPRLNELAINVSVSAARDCGLDELIAKNDAQKN